MWTAGVGGACVCGRTPAARGYNAAVLRAGQTWRQSSHMVSCCLWSIAAKHNQCSALAVKLTLLHAAGFTGALCVLWNVPCTLWRSIRKSVDCWCHTPGRAHHRLGRPLTGSQSLASLHGAGNRKRESVCVEDGSINILKNADTQQSVIHPD